jgi:hypothetical protein
MLARRNWQARAQMQKRPALGPDAAFVCVSDCGVCVSGALNAQVLADRSLLVCASRCVKAECYQHLAPNTLGDLLNAACLRAHPNRFNIYVCRFGADDKPVCTVSVSNGGAKQWPATNRALLGAR